jgi:hypothetical protein
VLFVKSFEGLREHLALYLYDGIDRFGRHSGPTPVIGDPLGGSKLAGHFEHFLEFLAQYRAVSRLHIDAPSIHHILGQRVGVFHVLFNWSLHKKLLAELVYHKGRAQFVPNSTQNLPTSYNKPKQQNPPFQRVVLMANVLQAYLF